LRFRARRRRRRRGYFVNPPACNAAGNRAAYGARYDRRRRRFGGGGGAGRPNLSEIDRDDHHDDSDDCPDELSEGEVACRVCVGEGIVADIGVAVEALGVGRILDDRIGRHEPAYLGVVDAAVHVDEAHIVDHLVADGRSVALI